MEREELIKKIRNAELTIDECLNLSYHMGTWDASRVLAEMWYAILEEVENNDSYPNQTVADNLEEMWAEE